MPMNPEFLAKVAANDKLTKKMEQQPGRGITLEDINQLVLAAKDNTNLTTLILAEQDIDDDMAIALSALKNIEVLVLDSNRITEKSAPALSKMPKLWKLSLAGNEITDKGAECFNKPNITFLDISANKLTGTVGNIFLNNTTLTYLNADFNSIDESILNSIYDHIKANEEKASQLRAQNSRPDSLVLQSGQNLFNSNESKKQAAEVMSPTEQSKIKTNVINQLNSLPENTRKEFIETLMNSCGLSTNPVQTHQQTYVK